LLPEVFQKLLKITKILEVFQAVYEKILINILGNKREIDVEQYTYLPARNYRNYSFSQEDKNFRRFSKIFRIFAVISGVIRIFQEIFRNFLRIFQDCLGILRTCWNF
jgi:hypothetical protein